MSTEKRPACGPEFNTQTGSEPHKLFAEFLAKSGFSKVVLLSDETVSSLYADLFSFDSLLLAPRGERAKCLSVAGQLWSQMLELGMDRSSLLVNLGGGSICDLGGWLAASYMRGIRFVNIPTTLLAQIDAAHGGKVGINLAGKKNCLGAFAFPELTIVSSLFWKSLSKEHIREGLSEGLKHAFLSQPDLLQQISEFNLSSPQALALVEALFKIKLSVVTADERESGKRKILNFGHTVAHALESLAMDAGEKLSHGQAVAEGMLLEAALSQEFSELSEQDFQIVEHQLRALGFEGPSYLEHKLTEASPESLSKEILARAASDKKNKAGTINWSLLKALGKPLFDQRIDSAACQSSLSKTLRALQA